MFSPSSDCLFILFMTFFAVQKLTSLIRFHLFIFAFIFITLGDWTKKTLVLFMSENVFHMFSSRTFMVANLKFNLRAILSLFLCMMWECIITSLICGCPTFPTSLTGENVFAPLYILDWSCWCFSCLSWFQFVTHPAQLLSRCVQHVG